MKLQQNPLLSPFQARRASRACERRVRTTSSATEGARQTVVYATALRKDRVCSRAIHMTTRSNEQRRRHKTGKDKKIRKCFYDNKFSHYKFAHHFSPPSGCAQLLTTSIDKRRSHTCGCCTASSFPSCPSAEGETHDCCTACYRRTLFSLWMDTQPNYTTRERKEGSKPTQPINSPPPSRPRGIFFRVHSLCRVCLTF